MSRYFLVTFLPELKFDSSPEISSQELSFYLQQNLSSAQMKDVAQLNILPDLDNLRSFLLGVPMKPNGSISPEELVVQLRDPDFIPPGTQCFCKAYPSLMDRQEHAHELIHSFLRTYKDSPRFVQKYFRFENTCRLILSWLRAKDLQRTFEVDPEEIGFDINDMNQWPELFQGLCRIWNAKRTSPSELEAALSQWKFQSIDTLCDEDDFFSLDLIFAYLIKLRIVEDRQSMNDPRHQLTLQEMVTSHD